MINTIIEIAATVIDTLFLVWFIPQFVGVSVKEKYWTLALPALQLAVQLVFDHYLPGFSLLPMIIMFVIVFAFALSLSPKTILWDIFGAAAYISIMMLVSSLLFSVFSLFIDNMGELMQGSQTSVRFIYIAVAKLVQFLLYQLVLKLFRKNKELDLLNGLLSFAITVVTVLGLANLMRIAANTESEEKDTSILVLALILVLVNVALYVFIYRIQKLQKSKYELKLINDRIDLEEKHSKEANTIWNNIRKVRHDLKNHFSVMQAQLDKGDITACKDYLNNIQETTVENMGTLIRSGNTIVDYLINSQLSDKKDIQVLITGSVGDFDDIADADMVSILGNIIDNAVEAVEKTTKTKRIEIYFSRVKGNRIIVCKNTVEEKVLEKNRKLFTTKSDASSHGLGHQIVESTVKKYNGFVDYFEEDDMFGVQISIPEQ